MGFRGPEVQILSFRPVGQGVAVSRNSFFILPSPRDRSRHRRVALRRYTVKRLSPLFFAWIPPADPYRIPLFAERRIQGPGADRPRPANHPDRTVTPSAGTTNAARPDPHAPAPLNRFHGPPSLTMRRFALPLLSGRAPSWPIDTASAAPSYPSLLQTGMHPPAMTRIAMPVRAVVLALFAGLLAIAHSPAATGTARVAMPVVRPRSRNSSFTAGRMTCRRPAHCLHR